MKIILIIMFLVLSLKSFACDIRSANDNNDVMSQWLGGNSSFSRDYIEGKCALDKALNKLPISEKKVIANLIAKSYSSEIKNIKKLQTYNY